MKKSKPAKSTFEREMENPKFKKSLLKEYHELALSELILALMAEDDISVRKLAKEVGLASSVIQSVRSGRHSNLTLKSFIKLISALGGELAVKKGRHYISVKTAA
jgi:DNA-binding Xre family transcriptional regulator